MLSLEKEISTKAYAPYKHIYAALSRQPYLPVALKLHIWKLSYQASSWKQRTAKYIVKVERKWIYRSNLIHKDRSRLHHCRYTNRLLRLMISCNMGRCTNTRMLKTSDHNRDVRWDQKGRRSNSQEGQEVFRSGSTGWHYHILKKIKFYKR